MKLIVNISLIFALLFVAGCKNCANRRGELQEISHTLPPFSSLDVEGKFNITLVQSDTTRVTYTGYRGFIETVLYEVKDNQLIINNTNKCSNLNKYDDWVDLRIELDTLDSARFSVPGMLTSEGVLKWKHTLFLIDNCDLNTDLHLNFNHFELRLDGGTSTVELKGNNQKTTIYNNGNGHVYAKGLINTNFSIFSIGTGVIESTVTNNFVASVQGSTEVYYYGNPKSEDISIIGNQGANVIKR